MARPKKQGLEYFPVDISIMTDRKLRKVKLKYGTVGFQVYFALLCIIYADTGYYIDFAKNKQDDIIWEILDKLQGKFQPTAQTIIEVIEDLVESGLFSDDQFKSKIITSKRVQSTYYSATVERDAVNVSFDIWLLSENEMTMLSKRSKILQIFINRTINGVNRPINEVIRPIGTQSKVKESKVKESKVKESKELGTANPSTLVSDIAEIITLYNEKCPKLIKATELMHGSRECAILNLLTTYGKDMIINVFEKANSSNFLTGGGKNKWIANIDWVIQQKKFVKIHEGVYSDKDNSASSSSYDIEELDEYWNTVPTL